MSSSKHPTKKDKGKAVQKAEDYQFQIPHKINLLHWQIFLHCLTKMQLQILPHQIPQMTMLFALQSICS